MITGIRTTQRTRAAGARALRLGEGMTHALHALVRFDAYRPELYYMRGPGPKWHAKHARAVAPWNVPTAQRAPTNLSNTRPIVA
jgi:hypothetical protein